MKRSKAEKSHENNLNIVLLPRINWKRIMYKAKDSNLQKRKNKNIAIITLIVKFYRTL